MPYSYRDIADAIMDHADDTRTWATVDEITRAILSRIGRKKTSRRLQETVESTCDHLCTNGDLLVRIDNSLDGCCYRIRRGYFANRRVLVSLTPFERQNRILIPGHRFVPFLRPTLHPGTATIICGQEPLPVNSLPISVEEAYIYLSLLGSYGIVEYLNVENPAPTDEHTVSQTMPIEISVFDLSNLPIPVDEAPKLLLEITDPEHGIVTLVDQRSERDPIDFKTTLATTHALDMCFESVFLHYGPTAFSPPGQIAAAYASMPEEFLDDPPFHFGGYLQMTEHVAITPFASTTILWRQGDDPLDHCDPYVRDALEELMEKMDQAWDAILDDELWDDNDHEPGTATALPAKHARATAGANAAGGRQRDERGHGADVPDPNANVIALKVALRDAKRINRIIEVHEDNTWHELHEAIFKAFDRYDEHLYAFYLSDAPVRSIAAPFEGILVAHPDAFDAREESNDATRFTIGNIPVLTVWPCYYVFDFGDEWWHVITVQTTDYRPDADPKDYPRITERTGKSPAQYPRYQ